MLTFELILAIGAPGAAIVQTLPARFEADRVYVAPQLPNGETMTFYTDTGGGLFITESAAQRLKLPLQGSAGTNADAESPPSQYVLLPTFKPGSSIPAPSEDSGHIRIMPTAVIEKQGFNDGDGMLGEAWFANRIWTWDYPKQTLTVEAPGWKPHAHAKRVPLGFPVLDGKRAANFARIAICVDGKRIDMLLDTGATTTLNPDALAALGDHLPAKRATSFIVATQFDTWHKAHPDWRVIEKAEHKNVPMIEVPEVEIGGATVGPVWFTYRSDANFHDYMSSMMDGQVEGAIGGNAFRHFAMTIDYPGAAAYFVCKVDCKPTPRSAP